MTHRGEVPPFVEPGGVSVYRLSLLSGFALLVIGIVAAAALLLTAPSEDDRSASRAESNSTAEVVDFGNPVTTDLTPFGIRAVIDASENAAVSANPLGATIRFPDGTELTVETTSRSLPFELEELLADRQAAALVSGADEFLVQTGQEYRRTLKCRKDIRVGGQTIRAAASWSVSEARSPQDEAVWISVKSLRQTDAQLAAEPIRAEAIRRLSEVGVKLTDSDIGGLSARITGPVSADALALLADVPDITEIDIADIPAEMFVGTAAFARCRNLRKLTVRGKWLTDERFAAFAACGRLEEVRLAHTSITDAGLTAIAGLKDLRSLAIVRDTTRGTDPIGITGSGLSHLSVPSKLQSLSLAGQRLTETGMANVPDLPALEALDLSRSGVTDGGLKAMKSLDRLRSLDLSHTSVTGAGLKVFAGAARLESLNLSFMNATDSDIASLQIPSLKALDLAATRVGDGAAGSIAALTGLMTLNLSHTRFADRGVRELAGLQKLSVLDLRHTEVAGKGLDALRTCPSLFALDLTGCPCGDEAFRSALAIPKLSRISMTDTRLTEAGLRPLIDYPRDQPLTVLADRTGITPEIADEVVRLHPKVSLAVQNAVPRTFEAIPAPPIGPRRLPDPEGMIRRVGALATVDRSSPDSPIIRLRLNGGIVGDTDLADIRGLAGLRSLTIRSDRVTDAGLAYLAGLTALEELHLDGTSIAGEGFVHLAGMANLRKLRLPPRPLSARTLNHLVPLKGLEEIDIPDDSTASCPAALVLYSELPNLRRLHLQRVGNADLLRLGRLTALRELRFRTWSESADAWGMAGLRGMTGLSRIAIEGGIDDRGVALLSQLPELESLEITNGVYVTDDGAGALSAATELETLAIHASRIGDTGLARLLGNERLKEVDLTASRVTDRGVAAVATSRLKSLSLANTALTDASIPVFIEAKSLVRLSLRGSFITPAGVELLKTTRPDLTVEY